MANQLAMQVVGNNVANAGNEDYVRQTTRLDAIPGAQNQSGFSPGLGVEVGEIRRYADGALEERLRSAISNREFDDLTTQILARIESLYNEMSEYDLSSSLNEFFNSFSELQNNPQDRSIRAVVIQTAEALTSQTTILRNDISKIHTDLNSQLRESIDEVNRISSELAVLNGQVVKSLANGGNGSGLLDQREGLLRELSAMADIQVVEHESGSATVYFGNDPLVDYEYYRTIKLSDTLDGSSIVAVARFTDNNGPVQLSSGRIGSIIDLQQNVITDYINQLDTLAGALINEVNKLHSSGQGLEGYTSIESTNAASDVTTVLDQLTLPVQVTNGSFVITVTDNTDPDNPQSKAYNIRVDLNGLAGDDTTLTTLAADINNCANISASITASGKIQITSASDNYSFTFSEDTSYVLAALGINGFFTGTSAVDIAVNPDVVSSPGLLAASQNHSPGDGDNATAIAGLRYTSVSSLSQASIMDYYRSIVSGLGVENSAARNNFEAHNAIYETLRSQRESVSGVSIDEETIELMSSQHAFQGAAKYISVISELIREMIDMI